MQVSELQKLADWFDEIIVEQGISKSYTEFANKLNQVVSNNGRIPFENERNQLIELIKTVSFDGLTLEQIALLKHLEIYELLGISGENVVQSILTTEQLDLPTAAKKINDLAQRISKTETLFASIASDLHECFSGYSDDDPIERDAILRVYFQEDAAILDLHDFKEYGNTWYQIGYGITLASGGSIEDLKVTGAEKGSIILELSAFVGAASLFSWIVLQVLKVADRVLEIRKKSEEITALKLGNVKIAQDILKSAEKEEKDSAKQILNEAKKRLKLRPDRDGDKITALQKSIEHLIEFSKDGGRVDIIETDEIEENTTDSTREAAASLHDNIIDIRALESRMKFLETHDEGE